MEKVAEEHRGGASFCGNCDDGLTPAARSEQSQPRKATKLPKTRGAAQRHDAPLGAVFSFALAVPLRSALLEQHASAA